MMEAIFNATMPEIFDEDNIGDELKRLRETRGLTQTELGALADMTQEAISRIENDKGGDIKMSTINRLLKALNVHLTMKQRKPS